MTPAPMSRAEVLAVMDRWVRDARLREFTDCMFGAKEATRETEAALAAVAALYDRHEALVEAARNLRSTSPTYSIEYGRAEQRLDECLATSTTPTEAKAADQIWDRR